MLKNLLVKKDKRSNLEKEIDTVLTKLSTLEPDSKEYTATVKNLETLMGMNKKESRLKVNPDTVLSVVGSLSGILLILNFEKADTITTKAMSFILKKKI